MLPEDISYVENLTQQIKVSGVNGRDLMTSLIDVFARNVQIIAVVGSAQGVVELLSKLGAVVEQNADRLDTMHEALVSGIQLQNDLAEQGTYNES